VALPLTGSAKAGGAAVAGLAALLFGLVHVRRRRRLPD
jgi:LPXTG-motif cell wall-anchored protein